MSGGIVNLWRMDKVEVLHSFKGESFVGIKLVWNKNVYYVENIYSSCLLGKKKEMWANLLILKDKHRDGEWILGGDFNATKNKYESKGRSGREFSNGTDLFDRFIIDSGLVDIPCKGKKLSWYSGDGRYMSRIDHFLVSNVVVNRWAIVGQLIGRRDLSDHYPVWLVADKVN